MARSDSARVASGWTATARGRRVAARSGSGRGRRRMPTCHRLPRLRALPAKHSARPPGRPAAGPLLPVLNGQGGPAAPASRRSGSTVWLCARMSTRALLDLGSTCVSGGNCTAHRWHKSSEVGAKRCGGCSGPISRHTPGPTTGVLGNKPAVIARVALPGNGGGLCSAPEALARCRRPRRAGQGGVFRCGCPLGDELGPRQVSSFKR